MARRVAAAAERCRPGARAVRRKAENAEIWDVEGRRWIDFCAGIAVVNTGHCHPRVVEAARQQLAAFTHTCFQVVAYESYVELCERLNAAAPGSTPKKSFLVNTGAEAVENAVKIARAATGRSGLIAFGGGFHGRTMFGMALTGKVAPYKIKFGPFPGEIFHVPFPNALQGVSEDDSIAAIERLFHDQHRSLARRGDLHRTGAGRRWLHPGAARLPAPPAGLCDTHGILLVADEVQTGIARCGKLFASEHYGVEPDIITMAKGLGGGLPIAAVVGKAADHGRRRRRRSGFHLRGQSGGRGRRAGGARRGRGRTALRALDGARRTHAQRFGAMMEKFSTIAEVRGLGAMTAVEFCRNGDAAAGGGHRCRLKNEAAQARPAAPLVRPHGNVLRVMVPLTISDAVLDEGLDIIEASLRAIAA
jgi:4-aminobutyrate aminotransferase/(S)-3-amino-2-methylpropionate transaminase